MNRDEITVVVSLLLLVLFGIFCIWLVPERRPARSDQVKVVHPVYFPVHAPVQMQMDSPGTMEYVK